MAMITDPELCHDSRLVLEGGDWQGLLTLFYYTTYCTVISDIGTKMTLLILICSREQPETRFGDPVSMSSDCRFIMIFEYFLI